VPDNFVMVSAVSAWEISIKKALGKLSAPDDLEQQVDESGFASLPISIAHGLAAGKLPRHRDGEALTIVTLNKRFCERLRRPRQSTSDFRP
jgi:PIN domain nuclease of toxin-antitoxin system